ncbi:hypothetical protein Ahia01_001193900 [Argonauta hians]
MSRGQVNDIVYRFDCELEVLRSRTESTQREIQVVQGLIDRLLDFCYSETPLTTTQVISPTFRRQQSFLFDKLHPTNDVELDFRDLGSILSQINRKLKPAESSDTLYYILKLSECKRINFKTFSILAALSEKVSQLEPLIQNIQDQSSYAAFDIKLKRSKELFQLLSADTLLPGDVTTSTAIYFELVAGRMNPEETAMILAKLSRPSVGFIHFFDYLTYLPFFIKVHQTIIDNPL